MELLVVVWQQDVFHPIRHAIEMLCSVERLAKPWDALRPGPQACRHRLEGLLRGLLPREHPARPAGKDRPASLNQEHPGRLGAGEARCPPQLPLDLVHGDDALPRYHPIGRYRGDMKAEQRFGEWFRDAGRDFDDALTVKLGKLVGGHPVLGGDVERPRCVVLDREVEGGRQVILPKQLQSTQRLRRDQIRTRAEAVNRCV